MPFKLDNGITVDFRKGRNVFPGIFSVSSDGTALRNPRRPMFVSIRNPWGIRLLNYRLSDSEKIKGGVRLNFQMDKIVEGPMDWQLHECRPMQNVGDWTAGPQKAEGTSLALEIREVCRKIGGRIFKGLSYRYFYKSEDIPIYYIQDRGTWEIGGKSVGNELWFRNANFPSIHKISSVKEHFSSEWYLENCANSNIFQFLPLQTHLQGFTMTASDKGVLLTWCPKVSHIRTLIEKPRGTDEIVHIHEHCGDLSYSFKTEPMEVLFAKGGADRVERANIHGAMIDLVCDTLHAEAGLKREYASTYGQIEEWIDADLNLYRKEGLPALADAGMKNIELANHFQNNMNTWGVSNFCCTVDLKVSENIGEDRLHAFCTDAEKRGIRVLMWGNTAISSLTVKFAHRNGKEKRINFLPQKGSIMDALHKAKRPFVRNSFGAIDADHYTPEFCVLNIRDPDVRKYWLKSWRHLKEKAGVAGIFLDSSFNLSSDKFDWQFNSEPEIAGGVTVDQGNLLGGQRPAKAPPSDIQTMYFAHLSLIAEMQEMGYRYCCEDSGVFGLHRNGPDIVKRLDNLFLWNDFITSFNAKAIAEAGRNPDDIFFQGLAYRLIWGLFWDVPSRKLSFRYGGALGESDVPGQFHINLYKAYNIAAEHMRNRTILPDEAGVRYDYEGKTVIWAFKDFPVDFKSTMEVCELADGTKIRAKTLKAESKKVYLIKQEI